MAHVTVVTRNPAIAVGLTHHGYDVTDVRPDRHGDWARQATGTQAVVLELSDAIAADAAVRRLRADGNGVQVLVIAQDGWDEVLAHSGPGVRPLPLPVSLPSLMAALEELVAAGPIDVPPPPRNEAELLSAVARQVGLSITDAGTLAGEPPPHVVEEMLATPVAEVPEAAGEPGGAAGAAADVAAMAAVAEPPAAAWEPAPTLPAGAGALVAALAPLAPQLTGVAETAEVVVTELAERVGAEAAALLLPDGGDWHVAGSANLRPLEERLRLPASHWLVRTVVDDGRGLVVDGTDAAREELAGAPLASWDEVLAVPVPDVRGVFVAARGGASFDEESLRVACAVAEEAAPLLREALAVRDLARALAPYAELDD
ncbi:MAG TPA: GAF domain-containing protein [Mycobacteriales bacterium]|jgi:hypothetical protein